MQKILVIENDGIMRENIAELLSLSGYNAQTAPDGKSGIEKARLWLPDLIVCDIVMPPPDGYGVLFALSKSPETNTIPFIFLTGKAQQNDRRKGMELGADDYLTKPFEDSQLLTAIETRLKKQQALKQKLRQNSDNRQQADSHHDWLAKLSQNAREKRYQARQTLFSKDETPVFLFFLKQGKLKTYYLNPDGKEFITNIYEKDSFVGYKPILEKRNYNQFAETLCESQILQIPREDFLELIQADSETAHGFAKLISENLSEKEEDLLHLAYSSARKRAIRKLLELSGRQNKTIAITRSDLARSVGTTTETLVRIVSELSSEEILELSNSEIQIKNYEKLRALEKIV